MGCIQSIFTHVIIGTAADDHNDGNVKAVMMVIIISNNDG